MNGGCTSGPAPKDNFYRFELPEPQNHFDPPLLNGTLLVTRPWADALIGERHLLYRENSGTSQIHRYVYHRWVDSPTMMLQREIARYLRASRMADAVVTPELRTEVDYLLSCRIAKLERVLNGAPRVLMELELSITRMTDRHAVLLETYREEQQASDKGVAASIVTYNQVLAKILERFLADSSKIGHIPDTELTR